MPAGPYWPLERHHPETGYRELDFREQPFPTAAMERHWRLEDFTAYLCSWSAVARYLKDKGTDPIAPLEEALRPLWGPEPRKASWPLAGRPGRMP